MKNCIYCTNPTTSSDSFCSPTCKEKWQVKEERCFIQNGAIAISKKISEFDVNLQQKFIKGIGKRKAKLKLVVSEGVF